MPLSCPAISTATRHRLQRLIPHFLCFYFIGGKVSSVTAGCVQERAVRRLFCCDGGRVKMARYILPVLYILYTRPQHPLAQQPRKNSPTPPLSFGLCVCVLSYSWCTAQSCQKSRLRNGVHSLNCSRPCKGHVCDETSLPKIRSGWRNPIAQKWKARFAKSIELRVE